tara:strand:- start:496 stop:705 length:210 start_codon:yes stop_codon:yes gene_type:complete
MPRNRPGRPRTNDDVHYYGFTVGAELIARFDALREKKEAELGIQLSRTQMLAMLVKKEEAAQWRENNEL